MSIQVNLPFPGETFQSTVKLDVFDNDGNLVRVDNSDTWYEVVDFRVKWVEADNIVKGRFWVEVDIVRIDEEADKLDESPFTVIYREDHFQM